MGHRRLVQAAAGIRWAAHASPRQIPQAAEWLLQSAGRRRELAGAGLWRLPPAFLLRSGRALISPPVVPASSAGYMRPDDVVLGLAMDGEARAYPWWLLDDHHVANDSIAGRRVLVVLCEMCSSGVAFDPLLDGRRLTFEIVHVFNGTNAVQDRQTGSVWSPLMGTAIRGPLAGRRLSMIPLVQMRWDEWSAIHPHTTVLAEEVGRRDGHGAHDDVPGSPTVPPGMRATLSRWDERLPHNTLVLGVVTKSGTRAYPLDILREAGGVRDDEIGGEPIVIFGPSSTGGYAALAFSRRLEGRLLSFEAGWDGTFDRETATRWSPDGLALQGPLAGKRLEFVRSSVAEWFVWPAHYPDIEVAV